MIRRQNAKPLAVIPPAAGRSRAIADIRQSTRYPTEGREQMAFRSFRFLDSSRSRELRTRLRRANIPFTVDHDGSVRFSADDEERVENEIIGPMRDEKFSSWQLLFCPPSWAARYKAYMSRHNVPFEEQWVDDGPCFLIPKQYRPHTWHLESASIPRRIKSA